MGNMLQDSKVCARRAGTRPKPLEMRTLLLPLCATSLTLEPLLLTGTTASASCAGTTDAALAAGVTVQVASALLPTA
jgi:hypothetical protein